MRILQWVKLDICTKFFRSLSQQLPVKCFFLVFLWTFMSCHSLLNFTKQKIITVKITTKKFSFAFERSLTTIKNIKKSEIWEKTQRLKISKKKSHFTLKCNFVSIFQTINLHKGDRFQCKILTRFFKDIYQVKIRQNVGQLSDKCVARIRLKHFYKNAAKLLRKTKTRVRDRWTWDVF